MGGVNYMGGKRNAARFRAKDMTSRIQKGFFRKQKLASLTKAQSGRVSAASREAEPISLSHAVHRRDSRDEAPTISLHVKRTNSTSSRAVEKEEPSRVKTGGRSEFLDALDTTEPTLLRGLLNRVLATPDLAGLSTRKRKRTPPPPYTPAKRRRADAREVVARRRENRHVSPDTSYVMVPAHEDHEEYAEEPVNPTVSPRISNPFDTSEDESEPSQTGFVTNYRTSTCSDHQRTSSTNLTSPVFAANNAIHSARVQDWPDNIFEHKDPWKSIGRIIGLHEDAIKGSNINFADGPLASLPACQHDLIADDEDGWFEIPSTPPAPSRISKLPHISRSQEIHERREDDTLEPLELPLQPQAGDVNSDRSYVQDLSSRPPSSLASTSSHSLHTSIFRDSVGEHDQHDRLRSTTAPSTSSPASFVQDKLSSDTRRSDDLSSRSNASSSRPNGFVSSSRPNAASSSRVNAPSSPPDVISSRDNEAGTSSCDGRTGLSAPSDGQRLSALSDGSSLPARPLVLTRSPAARLFLSSVHSGSSRPTSRYAQSDGRYAQSDGQHAGSDVQMRPSTTHILSSDGSSSVSRPQHLSSRPQDPSSHPQNTSPSTHTRFGAMSQLISEAPSPAESRPRTRKPFYGDQHSASTSSPLRISARTSSPLQPRDTFNDSAPKFTETIPSRDQLVHYASSSPHRASGRSPHRSSVRLVQTPLSAPGDALPALSPLLPASRNPLFELGEPPGKPLPAFSKHPVALTKSPGCLLSAYSKPLPTSALPSTPVSRPPLLPASGFESPTSISSALYEPRIKGPKPASATGEPDEAVLETTSVLDLFVQSPEGGFEPLRHSEPGSPVLLHAPVVDALAKVAKRADNAAVVRRGEEAGTGGRASSAAGRVTTFPTGRSTPYADVVNPAKGDAKPAKDADLSSALLVAAGIVPIGADPGGADEGKGNGPCLFFADAMDDDLESDE
ncbi:hypothetical protein EV122DRAFT_217788 [Schizophyllum commune]